MGGVTYGINVYVINDMLPTFWRSAYGGRGRLLSSCIVGKRLEVSSASNNQGIYLRVFETLVI